MKKKLITGVLATLACVACFAGCDLLAPLNNPFKKPVSSNVEEAKDFLYEKYKNENKETRKDYEVVSNTLYDGVTYTVEWSVNVENGVKVLPQENDSTIIDVDVMLAEDLPYVLTATVSDGKATAQASFERTVLALDKYVPLTITQAPVEGTPYKLHVYQDALKKDLYIDGEIKNDYYFRTDYDIEDGIDIYVENVEGGFYLYHSVNDVKTYINVVKSGNYTNAKYQATPSNVWTYSADYGTVVTTVGGTVYYLGADGTYDTVEPQSAIQEGSFVPASGYYMGYLVELADREKASAADKVAQTEKELSVNPVYVGANDVLLSSNEDRTYPDATITWEIVSGEGAELVYAKHNESTTLKIAEPSATSVVALKATIANGSETIAKNFNVSLVPNTEAAIVAAAATLKTNEKFGNEVTLTGTVVSVNSPYDSSYGNATITIKVADTLIECYRLSGVGADTFSNMMNGRGYTVTVKGIILKHNNDIQFDKGCILEEFAAGTAPSYNKLTIAEALALGKDFKDDVYSAEEYYVSGMILNISGKDMTIVDEFGNSLYLYSVTDMSGNNYNDMNPQPSTGDTITVLTCIGKHSGSVQSKNGFITQRTPGEPIEETKMPIAISSAPATGVAYKLWLSQNTASTSMYLTGGMSGNFYGSSEYSILSADVYLESAGTEGYYMYHMKGGKKYFDLNEYQTGKFGVRFTDTANTVWTWNTQHQVLTTKASSGDDYYLGTYNNYTTFSASKISYITSNGNFAARLCTMEDIPAADATLTLTEANAIGGTKAKNEYTDNKYSVSGVITKISDANKGQFTITDANGVTFDIYGSYNEDGTVGFKDMTIVPAVNDTVTVYGIIGRYNAAQMKSGWITSLVEGVPPQNQTISLAKAVEIVSALSEGVETTEKYVVTAQIKEITSTSNGSCILTDGTLTIETYKLLDKDGNQYDAMTTKPAVGDMITIQGKLKNYNGTLQFTQPVIQEHYQATDIPTIKAMTEASTGKYYVSGTITEFYGQYGSSSGYVYIEDADNNKLLIYGLYNYDGTVRYNNMTTKPTIGDTISVLGAVTIYDNNAQIKNGWVIAHTVPAPATAFTGTKADFTTFNNSKASTNYETYRTTDGWIAVDCSIAKVDAAMNADTPLGPILDNGAHKIADGGAPYTGVVTSPLIANGIKSLKFNYGFNSSDTQLKLLIEIKDSTGAVVATTTIDKEGLTSKTAYEFTWTLPTAVSGNFTIVITNAKKTTVTAGSKNTHKDRVILWDLTWENYAAA